MHKKCSYAKTILRKLEGKHFRNSKTGLIDKAEAGIKFLGKADGYPHHIAVLSYSMYADDSSGLRSENMIKLQLCRCFEHVNHNSESYFSGSTTLLHS